MSDLNTYIYIDKHPGSYSLNGEWSFSVCDTEREISTLKFENKAILPASVYKCMHTAGLLPNSHYGDNSKLYRDLKLKAFYFKKNFTVNGEDKEKQAFLCFDGTGYYTDIWLNGEYLGQHIGIAGGPYINITDKLKYGVQNELIVCSKSPAFGKPGYNAWKPKEVIMPWGFAGDAQCSNGNFTINGLWSDIRIEFISKLHISRPFLSTVSVSKTKARLHLSAEISDMDIDETKINFHDLFQSNFAFSDGIKGAVKKLKPELTVKISDGDIIVFNNTYKVSLTDYKKELVRWPSAYCCSYFEKDITIDKPKFWWPCNMGDPHLYKIELELSVNGQIIDSLSFKHGIRTVEHDFTKAVPHYFDRQKWQFIINGRPVFLRGINSMPFDFSHDTDRNRYEKMLKLTKDANIGFIRLWGAGGNYESDTFYELCDELGILVWQDSFIANMVTPEWNIHDVASLTAVNVYRIRNHSSLAVWCGGNEFPNFHDDNAAVLGKIRQITTTLDWTRHFFDTTPLGGSAHCYNDMEPTLYRKNFSRTPFVGESGIHSFPCYKGFKKYFSDEDIEGCVDSLSPEFQKRHPKLMCHFVENNPERVPRMLARSSQLIDISNATLENLCESTQISAHEFYQYMCDATMENYPITAGLMPWVLSRPWNTVGIQIIDYDFFPTMQYYAIKECFKNVTAMLCLEELTYGVGEEIKLKCAVINHLKQPLSGLELKVTVYSPDMKAIEEHTKVMTVQGYKKYVGFPSFKITEDYNDSSVFISVTLKGEGVNVRKLYRPKVIDSFKDRKLRNKFRSGTEQNFWFTPERSLSTLLKKYSTALNIKAEKITETDKFILKIMNTTDRAAWPVIIDSNSQLPIYPEDNCFFLKPYEERIIEIDTDKSNATELSVHGYNFTTVKINI